MHGIAMGGMLGVMMILIFAGEAFSVWPLFTSLLLTAAVISARKIITDHTWFEIAVGTLLGFGMQWLAWWL
jgi:branched-subunit amino acid transport protein AzlD